MADVNLQLREESRKLRELMEKQGALRTEMYKEKVWLGSHKDGFHDEVRAAAGYHKATLRDEVQGEGRGSDA